MPRNKVNKRGETAIEGTLLGLPRNAENAERRLPFLRPSISKFDDSAKVSHGLLLVLLNLAAAPHFLLFFSKCPVYSGVGTGEHLNLTDRDRTVVPI